MLQDSDQLVTDTGTQRSRAKVMQLVQPFQAGKSASCMEHITVFHTDVHLQQCLPPRTSCGEMTAHQFGYSNTAEAFIAIQVRPACRYSQVPTAIGMHHPLQCHVCSMELTNAPASGATCAPSMRA